MAIPRYEAMLVWRDNKQFTSPVFIVLDEMVQLDKLSWSTELVGEGSITFSINPDRQPGSVKAYLSNIANDPVEIWLYRDGVMVQAGPVIGVQTQGATVNIIARGIMYYLRYMFVTSDLDYKSPAVDQYTIAKNLINHWQGKTFADFGVVTSGIGTSGFTRSILYEANRLPNVLQAIERLAENIDGFEFYVDPTTRAFTLTGRRGSDKSASVILDSRSIPKANAHFSVAQGDFGTDAYVTASQQEGDQVFVGNWGDVPGIARWGRAGITMSATNVETLAIANDYAESLNASVNQLKFVPSVGTIYPVVGATVTDFDVGDTVTWIYDYGLGIIEQTRDVYRRWVKIDNKGEETMRVELY